MAQPIRGAAMGTVPQARKAPVLQQILPILAVLLVGLLVAWRAQVRRDSRRHRRTQKRYQSLFVNNVDAVVSLDPGGAVERVNPTFTRLTGWNEEETRGTAFAGYVSSEDRNRVLKTLKGATRGAPQTMETALQHRDGQLVEVELTTVPIVVDDDVLGAYQIARDIGQRKETERKLETQALHDYLTGLPNRSLFQDRLEHAIERGARTGAQVALLYLDLDRFKAVNDSAGHAAGDLLLQQVASRLSCFLRGGDTVARLGGDEFAILLEDISDVNAALGAGKRIADLLSEPIRLPMGDFETGASIGVALSSSDTESPEDLVRQADVAMYEAKRLGGHRFQLYGAELEEKRDSVPVHLEGDLRRAIQRDELTLHYQPIVDLAGTRIVGVEALVRWPHPELGMLAPTTFIPLAEESGIIVALDHWVLRRACLEIKGLIEQRVVTSDSFYISVNFSKRHLEEQDPAEAVERIVGEVGFDIARLQLEITESIAGVDREKVNRLKALGLTVAIDDFGTGYSSLGYLKDLDVDILKVDRSFVHALSGDKASLAIVRTILTLAEMLGMDVIIEGIEEPVQLRRLQELGGRFVQGFYFSAPVNLEGLEDLLRRGLPPEWVLNLNVKPEAKAAPVHTGV
jgi:Amt family ammonium transporter